MRKLGGEKIRQFLKPYEKQLRMKKDLTPNICIYCTVRSSIQYRVGTTLGCREVASGKSARQVSLPGKWVCQARESARQVSLPGKEVCQWHAKLRVLCSPAVASSRWVYRINFLFLFILFMSYLFYFLLPLFYYHITSSSFYPSIFSPLFISTPFCYPLFLSISSCSAVETFYFFIFTIYL